MKFFNQKEEVIDIQMTQYGKYLLSKGKFKPVYYCFFDDDVLYDVEYASASAELQNNTEPRVQQDTPRLKTQFVHAGLETNIKKINEEIRSNNAQTGDQKVLPTAEKAYALSAPLGTSDIRTNYVPAWDIRFLKSELSGAVNYQTGSFATLKIPQLDVDVKYKIYALSADEEAAAPSHFHGPGGYGFDSEFTFADGKTIIIEDNYILLDINEEHGILDKENFEIEVFMVEEEKDSKIPDGTKEVLIPLSFGKEADPDLLATGEGIPQRPDDDPSFVDYFFDVQVDEEISKEELRLATEGTKKSKSTYETPDQDLPEEKC